MNTAQTTAATAQCGTPVNAFLHVPIGSIVGYLPKATNRFEFEPVYLIDGQRLRESEALACGKAWYRVQIDAFTVRDFKQEAR